MAMAHRIEPELHPVPIRDLRPTQITVGMREVTIKRESWRARCEQDGAEFLGAHMIPAVVGPGDSYWLIDHHHLARALHEEGVEKVLVSVVAKLSHLPKKRFFAFMDSHNWLHPYDDEGKRCDWSDLPRHVGKLIDDPFRSLAGEVRRLGGYAKSQTPYTEFLWADFFRDRIRRHSVETKFMGTVHDEAETGSPCGDFFLLFLKKKKNQNRLKGEPLPSGLSISSRNCYKDGAGSPAMAINCGVQ